MEKSNTLNNVNSRIVFLDWLRIFAFSSVLIGHKFYGLLSDLSTNNSIHATPRLLLNIFLPFFFGGGAGVVVFFLISGYIIHHILQAEQPFYFLIKRLFRIYPLYVLAVLLHTSISFWVDKTPIELEVLFPQLLLIGDFFNTPHALNGVEWTLRIEVMFYIYMALLGFCQLTTHYRTALPWVFLLTVLLLGNIPAIPSQLWNLGYFNTYAPFLFLGAIFSLYENKEIKATFVILFGVVVLVQYWHLIATLLPGWRNTHFSFLAVLLFSFTWLLKNQFIFNKTVFFISELTYAVYLIHNWFFDYAIRFFIRFGINHSKFYSLLILFLTSALLVRLAEKPGVKLGRKVIHHLKKYDQEKSNRKISSVKANYFKSSL